MQKEMKRKNNPIKVLVVATSRKTQGGISAVIAAYEQCDFWKDYNIKWLETHIDKNIINKWLYCLKSFCQFIFIVNKYDVIQFHIGAMPSVWRKYIFFKTARLCRKRTIIHLHIATHLAAMAKKRIFCDLLANADGIIVLTPHVKHILEENCNINDAKIHILNNPCPQIHLVDDQEKENIILFAGGISKLKGYDDLIQAFASVAQSFPEWKLVFAGSGDIENGKQLALQSGVYDKIMFLGWIRGEEKDRWFRKARIFCLPSYAEGFPMALLDACSYGIPFIVTPVGGIPDIVVNNQNGLLFTPGDIPALASCLQRLMEDAALREKLGAEALHLAQTTFSLAETDRLIRQIYSAV
jgi:glycosyltransferase involved in cell wall biosynthesis